MHPTTRTPLYTQHDREVDRLRREIEKLEMWIAVDGADRRAVAFHKARLDMLRSELHALLDSEK
jgi:hypothetical protein